jgi:hypothetical protein
MARWRAGSGYKTVLKIIAWLSGSVCCLKFCLPFIKEDFFPSIFTCPNGKLKIIWRGMKK